MERCPSCGKWALSFDPFRGIVSCYNCNYEKKVSVEKYLQKNDLLPKLTKSLVLNGYKLEH